MLACNLGNFEIVKLLLQHNADTNLKNNVSIGEYSEGGKGGLRMCNSVCKVYL